MSALPIDPILPELAAAMAERGCAVLQAPPGAGKTTRVPLALMPHYAGRIVMLEPRRLAARAAAERLAEALGERPGGQVGYRMRGESVAGSRIEVVTEGILTRMIQSDPELSGIGCLVFDEFHERSLNADLGLALALECREALRPDLGLLVMSATLDAAPVAALLGDAPLITSEGRAFPVELRHLPRPVPKSTRFEAALADLVTQALAETEGGVLAFLPGEGEIRRVAGLLAPRLPGDVRLRPLYGALPFAEQRAAVRPEPEGRKLVLATSIAETSLTIEDVRTVIDGGRARRARFDPASGMSRLVTERVTRAEATQRAGRAGRVAPGVAYRLWSKGEEGALAAFAPAEIEIADLTGLALELALELALWGSADLRFLTPPPEGALSEARALLHDLGALDATGITAHGRRLAAQPVHPRLGHMLERAGKPAAPLAALLSERDPLRGAPADVGLRLRALSGERAAEASRAVLERIRAEARRLAARAPAGGGLAVGQMAALAYPDRIALRRKGGPARYVLSGGKGAVLDEADPLAGARLLVAFDLDGDAREARIRLAAPLSEAELRDVAGERIGWVEVCAWSRRERRVLARRQERLGALVLDDRPLAEADPAALAAAMCDGIRELGLALTGAAARFRARVELVRQSGIDLPEMTDAALLASLEDWLAPHLDGVRSAEEWKRFDALPALRAMLDWPQMQALDAAAPARFTTPLGRAVAIDYDGDHPGISVRLQELFGLTTHPTVAGRPLRLTLLSPGHKPVQVTMDLPGFWASSYADVRKDMRGRYPKHPWPEDPTVADPTLRAKPRR
ncbi:ATP-dependent helicase HrpB [Oceanicola granulosus HTCC2516]|uniref:ATP-dependent helicase HrpB n=1 Tax=Oceanicola granulosus (strain ATCC BAA-861 / DSM 15982 / KCTC 12143 / HTCC2516) TaxID=314256 RepID=Q2CFM9_OCEGH|nr:ATP-dependent helicase HrpB [Oceanicola granulosus]EAR51453.1 ATP-dependent helicase HrpB [Oceanicola granulosus HTCC2516]